MELTSMTKEESIEYEERGMERVRLRGIQFYLRSIKIRMWIEYTSLQRAFQQQHYKLPPYCIY